MCSLMLIQCGAIDGFVFSLSFVFSLFKFHSMRTLLLVSLAIALWGTAVGSGILLMSRFSNTAGSTGAAPVIWPAQSSLPHRSDRATLLMFAHPRCGCTSASVEQLKKILCAAPGTVDCQIVFLTPPSESEEWKTSQLVHVAESIPGVTVVLDPGMETRRFGAATSGHVLLYDATGRLAFAGGITIARGHAGDNGGTQTVIQLLNHEPKTDQLSPTFGCPLFNDVSSVRESVPCRQRT
jgi:hypothetical protein